MNWSAIGVVLSGTSMIGGVLYFALRSFLRAELAQMRAELLKDIDGTYLRKDVADERYELVMTRIDALQ